MPIADVAVVGGGPAGAAAAIELARAGRDVVLVDKARFPRDKCCGDGLTTAALRHLQHLGLRPDEVASWQRVEDVVVRAPGGRQVSFPLPRGAGTYAAVARRRDLDATLLDLARAAGVKVHDGHALVAARHDEARGAVDLDVTGLGTVTARYAVGADGMWSPLRKLVGAAEPGYLGEWHAFRQYFSGVTGAAARDLFVWFEADLLPGYAWAFPLPDGRANVGFGVLREQGRPTGALKQVWPDVLARAHVRAALGPEATPEAPHTAWPIPARVDHTTLHAAGGRVLFVGDAARAPDPMTGEGIGQALETGMLAAQAIGAAGQARPDLAAQRYDAAVRSGLAADTRFAAALGSVLRHRRGTEASVVIAGASAWTRRHFGRWLFEDYPRAVLLTPRRWRRGMFRGEGAWR